MPDATTAVLLIAHGSRREEANADLVRLAEMLRYRGEYAIVEPSYLEIAEPTIPQGAATCVAAGARCVLMLPFFLSAGSHVVDDLERHRRELAAAHPGVEFRLCPPLGLHPLMLDIIRDRLGESR
jgi:sirohydrochlorin ferrochelatase